MSTNTTTGEVRIVTVHRTGKSGDKIAYPQGEQPPDNNKPDGIHLPQTYEGTHLSENEKYKVKIMSKKEGYVQARILDRAEKRSDIEDPWEKRKIDFMRRLASFHRPN